MLRYPRTVEAHLHDALTRQDYSGAAFTALNAFLEGLLERTRDMLAEGDAQAQRVSVMQFWSAVLMLGLLPRSAEPFLGQSTDDDAMIELFAARLVAHFFPRA